MKHFFVSLLFIISLSSFGQQYFKPELYIGAKGGISFSSFNLSPNPLEQQLHQSNVFGGSIVYYSSYYWGIKWGLNLEFNQVQKGWIDIWPEDALTEYKRHMTYWDIPIYTEANFGTKSWRFIINGGPHLNFLTDGVETLSAPEDPIYRFPFYYGTPTHNKFQFGIGGGFAIAKTFPYGRFQVGGRLTQNLVGVFDFDRFNSLSSQHQYYEITAGLYIRVFGGNKRKKKLRKASAILPKKETSKDLLNQEDNKRDKNTEKKRRRNREKERKKLDKKKSEEKNEKQAPKQ